MHNVTGGFTFLGYIPDGSDKQHIGIVLGIKKELLKYCYCTSQFARIINNADFIEIPQDKMKVYFTNPKRTFIFLSARHIIDIFVVTFSSRLGSEYDAMPPIGNEVFSAILSKIRNSDNLPERFKNEFFQFLEEYP